MNHKIYKDAILEPIVGDWLKKGQDFCLEEDGDSGYSFSKGINPVKRWKQNKGLDFYQNCAGLPDFAIIENSWQVPKQYIQKYTHLDIETLRELALEGWKSLKQEIINK